MTANASVSFNLLTRPCKLVVLFCFLHMSVILYFYIHSFVLQSTFVQNDQQTPRFWASNGRSNLVPQTANVSRAEPGNASLQAGSSSRNSAKDTPQDGATVPKTDTEQPMEKCPDTSPHLVGPLKVEFMQPSPSLQQVKKDNPRITSGGRFRPSDCVALQKVAIIIPFRNRDKHLKYWLYYLHPILQRQQLDYGIYVINQDGEATFNRAKLLNIGYMEALKDYDYQCFVFSDVDLIPMDDRNTYTCFSQPHHLSVLVDKFGFRLPYIRMFGGVSSMSKEQYLKLNGFPNNYWGWGGEDDDVSNRLTSNNMSISRPSGEIGKYRMIHHKRDQGNDPNPQRFDRIAHTSETMHNDGINSLTYHVVKTERLDLFTRITVDLGSPPRAPIVTPT